MKKIHFFICISYITSITFTSAASDGPTNDSLGDVTRYQYSVHDSLISPDDIRYEPPTAPQKTLPHQENLAQQANNLKCIADLVRFASKSRAHKAAALQAQTNFDLLKLDWYESTPQRLD